MHDDANSPAPGVVHFAVREHARRWRVCEDGFEKAVAEFDERDTAEQYALRLAETKVNWKVDVHDISGALVATYNSEDDAMPKPAIE